jgi:hypothetical protein
MNRVRPEFYCYNMSQIRPLLHLHLVREFFCHVVERLAHGTLLTVTPHVLIESHWLSWFARACQPARADKHGLPYKPRTCNCRTLTGHSCPAWPPPVEWFGRSAAPVLARQ